MKNKKSIKQWLSILLSIALFVTLVPMGSYMASAETSSEITEQRSNEEFIRLTEVPEGYIGIYTKYDLDAVRNNLSGNYILMNDIEFTDEDFAEGGDFYNKGEGWTPIGKNENTPFTGILNGNSYTIKNLYINNANQYVGLFGYIQNSSITNLGLKYAETILKEPVDYYYSKPYYIGGIVGCAYSSIITNCYNTKNISIFVHYSFCATDLYVGGIAGKTTDGEITRCFNIGNITTENYYKSSSTTYVGGLIGKQENSTITNSYNSGKIESISTKGSAYAGGISGVGSSSIISNCYNTGPVDAIAPESDISVYAGGITGSYGTINNCYNVGNISASSIKSKTYVGGIAGNSNSQTNCYYLDTFFQGSEVNEENSIKCSLERMQQISTFIGFDFDSVWVIDSKSDYKFPQLKDNQHNNLANITNVKSIELTKKPDKLIYYDSDKSLDTTGLVITAYYKDNTSEIITDYSISEFYPNPGKKTISITYAGNTVSFEIEVLTTLFAGGSGTSKDPFLIETKTQLNNIRNYPASHFKLITDIEFTDADFAEDGDFYNYGKGWNPICDYNNPFTGILDGNGYAINNLQIKAKNYSYGIFYLGLFGCAHNATIKNLGMVDCNITGESIKDKVYIGSIVGEAQNTIIINCYNTGNITIEITDQDSDIYIGGITGYYGKITKSYNTGNISVVSLAKSDKYIETSVGGISGYGYFINKCYNSGNISITSSNIRAYAGGIAGDSGLYNVNTSYNVGKISAEGNYTYVGGIFGCKNGGVNKCYYLNNTTYGVGDKLSYYEIFKKTSIEMGKEETFIGFDFDVDWYFDSTSDYKYPQLRAEMTSIEVTQKPNKLIYTELQELDLGGLVITAYYKDNSTKILSDYEVRGYDCTPGTKTITVTFNGMITTFEVEVVAIEFGGGNGTRENPYLIRTKEQLANVRNYRASHFRLMQDIAFTEADFAEGGMFYNNGMGWIPICNNEENAFIGSFDGNSYTIKNMYINAKNTSDSDIYVGLFGYIESASIKDLGMVDPKILVTGIQETHSYIGSVAGCIKNSNITNCYNTGSIYLETRGKGEGDPAVRYYNGIGGIVGYLIESTVSECYNTGTISSYPVYSYDKIGGIIGIGYEISKVENCYNVGALTAKYSYYGNTTVGGIMASASKDVSITNCHNIGKLSGVSGDHIGSITGLGGTITNCYNTVDIIINGGVLGGISCGSAIINNCYNTGHLSSPGGAYGISGDNSVISDSYNTGNISGGANAGGISGKNSAITNCYNTGNITSHIYAGGISSQESEISYCYNIGTVTAESTSSSNTYAGGIVSVGGIVKNCYNAGTVTATATKSGYYSYAGGIISKYGISTYLNNTTVSKCYNIGTVAASASSSSLAYSGGIAAYSSLDMKITDCYYLNNISYGVKEDKNAVGNSYKKCTKTEMQNQETFEGFNFDTIWYFNDCNDTFKYPQLQNNTHKETHSIELTKKPDKLTYYEGEQFDSTGMIITAHKNTHIETVNDYKVLGYDSIPGKKTITIEYHNKTVSFDVFVIATVTFGGGYGEEESPFLIKTTAHLNNVRDFPSSYFKLANDIEFTDDDFAIGGAYYNNGEGWTPICNSEDNVFIGHFDGDGFAVKNLHINVTKDKNTKVLGLFGYVGKGTIKQLGIVDSDININLTQITRSSKTYVGSIAAHILGGTITNCYNNSPVTINISTTQQDFSIYHYVGGIAGYLENGSIINCYNTNEVLINISSDYRTYIYNYIGGVVGFSNTGVISSCYNKGKVSSSALPRDGEGATTTIAGGIAGSLANGMLSNCYNTGEIYINAIINSNYYYKSIQYSGGILGESTDNLVTNCYNTGKAKKGIAGYANNRALDYCYYLDIVSEGGTIDCIKCTYEEMQNKETFEGFDFTNVWTFDNSKEYLFPILRNAGIKKVTYGDINGDSKINLDDVVMLLRHVSKAQEITDPKLLEACNIVEDGVINLEDVVRLLRFVSKAIPSLK